MEGPISDSEVAERIAKQKRWTEGKDYTIVDRPGTTQCHAYVAKITKALGVGLKDKPRSNTCGLLTATVAVQLARLLNEQIVTDAITKALAVPPGSRGMLDLPRRKRCFLTQDMGIALTAKRVTWRDGSTLNRL